MFERTGDECNKNTNVSKIQLNISGSNTFGTMKISSRQG